MAAGDTQITIVGNLTHDPDLKFTGKGTAACNFQVASTPRFMDKQTNQWKDGDPLFLRCTAWGKFGENCAETLQRGMRVIVQGRLKQNNWEDKDGNKRTGYQVEVDDIGPSLKFATAKVNRAERQGGGGIADDPWASAAPAPPRQPAGVGAQGANSGWGGNTPGNLPDEPPF